MKNVQTKIRSDVSFRNVFKVTELLFDFQQERETRRKEKKVRTIAYNFLIKMTADEFKIP